MENYLQFPFSSSTSSPPSSSLSLNSNIFATENNNNNNYNNNSSAEMMKISSANNGFLGLMSEMERLDHNNIHQGNNISGGTSSFSQMSLETSTSENNKLGNNIMSSTKKNGSKGLKKVKKPRYAFQTRSQVDILDDGYRWRKYGQKAVKNNKFPRSYYRCTYQGCNVKKQVQRLTKDEGIVVTTYEGMHSHSIDKSTDNFEHILTQMQIYSSF